LLFFQNYKESDYYVISLTYAKLIFDVWIGFKGTQRFGDHVIMAFVFLFIENHSFRNGCLRGFYAPPVTTLTQGQTETPKGPGTKDSGVTISSGVFPATKKTKTSTSTKTKSSSGKTSSNGPHNSDNYSMRSKGASPSSESKYSALEEEEGQAEKEGESSTISITVTSTSSASTSQSE
jgi:hypothetical protein